MRHDSLVIEEYFPGYPITRDIAPFPPTLTDDEVVRSGLPHINAIAADTPWPDEKLTNAIAITPNENIIFRERIEELSRFVLTITPGIVRSERLRDEGGCVIQIERLAVRERERERTQNDDQSPPLNA